MGTRTRLGQRVGLLEEIEIGGEVHSKLGVDVGIELGGIRGRCRARDKVRGCLDESIYRGLSR